MNVPHLFEVNRYSFAGHKLDEIENNSYVVNQWPLVYVLSDERKRLAYIGETADAMTRMGTHLKHSHKGQLTVLHLISSEKFNKSATLDVESNLIKYMAADGKFSLLNGNLGLVDHNYYQKSELYSQIFSQIWNRLRAEGVVEHSLKHLDNSDLFKYSPYKSLSFEQRQGLLSIMYALLDDSKKNLIVEGGAGTGKSILAIFLFKLLQTEGDDLSFREFSTDELELRELLARIRGRFGVPKMALVVPMTSFRNTLKKAFSHIAGLSSTMVISPSEISRKPYDIVIVDEAHRLRRRINLGAYFGAFDKASIQLGFDKDVCTELDWVCKQSQKAIFFYDQDQSIKPSDVPLEVFVRLKASPDTQIQTLLSQFRVRGGNSYVQFVDALLNNQLGAAGKFAPRAYEFQLYESIHDLIAAIGEKEQEFGLSRMIAGYAWRWVSKNDSSAYDIEIDGAQLKWNKTSDDWINSPNSFHEVGCIHTTQGYDLNYAGIIFGPEIKYDKARDELVIAPDKYFDRNGKQTIKDPVVLKQFILNIYKTIMLRGIRGTFVYACDPGLREYLARYIPLNAISSAEVLELHPIQKQPFVNAVPLFNLRAAAGSFSELQTAEITDWALVPEGTRIGEDYFACHAIGESMNEVIPNGSICLFRRDRGGSRNGKIVLVEHLDRRDAETGCHYTIKEYWSEKYNASESWRHTRIILSPRSTDPLYQALELSEDDSSQYRVVGEFVRVLSPH
jgi:DUF2075 family protein/predicted GIY-YIG superfamily endonuclease/SOS-response transcriptional repressor LexA